MKTPRQILERIAPFLNSVAGDLSRFESECIISYATKLTRTELYTSKNLIPTHTVSKIFHIVRKRIKGTPLPYVLGSAYFYDREFYITEDVLIPRPDTECLIETILKYERKDTLKKFIDIGTGSGIILSILTEHCPTWQGFGVDRSFNACKVAQINSKLSQGIICADILTAFKHNNSFDFIVSNPPYIKTEEYNELDTSVKDHEPRLALWGGEDGCEFYKKISKSAQNILKPQGRIYFEIGYNQFHDVKKILQRDNWSNIQLFYDLGNRPRVISAIYKG